MGNIEVQRMDHVAIDVEDAEKAHAFYGGLLGLTEVPRPESFDFPGYWYDVGNSVLHVVGNRTPKIATHHFCLWVGEVHAAAEGVEAAGYPVKWDPYKIVGVDRFFTADPEGNRIEIQGKEKS